MSTQLVYDEEYNITITQFCGPETTDGSSRLLYSVCWGIEPNEQEHFKNMFQAEAFLNLLCNLKKFQRKYGLR